MDDALHAGSREQRQAELLAAFDDSLRRGEDSGSWSQEAVATSGVGDMQGSFDCLRLLEKAFPRHHPVTAQAQLVDRQAVEGKRIGRFVVERLLGYGGCGIVYLAHDFVLNRKVALKVPRLPMLVEPRQRARFLREARSAAALHHPNVIPVYEAGEADGVCYLVAEYCAGPNLAQWLQGDEIAEGQQPAPSAKIDPRNAAEIVLRLAHAVEHAHQQGILHRDIKPANVLLDFTSHSDGPKIEPRLTDFGLARLMDFDESCGTATGMIVGTPQYMAPEQAGGRRDLVGPQTDVYGLGVLLYELLTGRPPIALGEHPAQTLQHVLNVEPVAPRQLAAGAPKSLESICLKCLAKEPQRRYASAQELADDLDRFLADEPIRARPTTALDRLWKWCRHPAHVATAGIFTIALGGIGFTWCSVALVNILNGNIVVPQPQALLNYGLIVTFGLYLPWLWIGWQILRNRTWALWLTSLQGSCLCALLILIMLGAMELDLGGLYERTPEVRWVFEVFYLFLIVTFTLTQILGLIAHYSNRPSRPSRE